MKNEELALFYEALWLFPSPCGEMGMKNFPERDRLALSPQIRFRPLAGKWV